MSIRSLLTVAAAVSSATFVSSCGTVKSGLDAYHSYDRPAKLPKNPDAVTVKVSLSAQKTYVMEGPDVLMVMPVSVGAPDSPTPTGNFKIYKMEAKHRDGMHGYAYTGTRVKQTTLGSRPAGWSFKGTPMSYWCGFKANYGFHTGWIKHQPCTNGCIRMHENLAPKFFRLVSIGTPVSIARSQPEDVTIAKIPLPPDAGPLPDYNGSMYIGDGYFSQHKEPRFD